MNSTTTTLADLDNDQLRDRIESLPYTEDAKDQVRAELERVDVVIDARVLHGIDLDHWHRRRAMLEANLADFGRDPRPMTQRQWDALEAAEKPLYGYGTHAYTDVTPREESGDSIVAKMWEAAEENILNNAETDPGDDDLREETARRVAYANAILVFGTEFVGIAPQEKQPLRESIAYEYGRTDAAAGRPMMTAERFQQAHERDWSSTTGAYTYYVKGYEATPQEGR